MPTTNTPRTWSDALQANPEIRVIQELLDCFRNGDVSGILERLDDAVEWQIAGNPDRLPFAGFFTGKAGVLEFFKAFGQNVEVSELSAANFSCAGAQVFVETRFEGRAAPTGKVFVSESRLVWTFNDQGKIQKLEQTGDVSAIEAAFF